MSGRDSEEKCTASAGHPTRSKVVGFAFAGKMGSGKDTAAECARRLIERELNCSATVMKFADPLYEIMHFAQKTAGFPAEKDREFLQWVGTEWGRKRRGNVWVDCLLRRARCETARGRVVLVSDLRFENELRALNHAGFHCVLISREHQRGRNGTGSHGHLSERALENAGIGPDHIAWAHTIDNSGSLSEFKAKVRAVVRTSMQQ